jgi:hypothetical protein
MKIKRVPEEFLVRWAPAGGVQGAHVRYRNTATDDEGNILRNAAGDPLMDVLELPTDVALAGEEMKALIGQAVVDLGGELWACEVDLHQTMAELEEYKNRVPSQPMVN